MLLLSGSGTRPTTASPSARDGALRLLRPLRPRPLPSPRASSASSLPAKRPPRSTPTSSRSSVPVGCWPAFRRALVRADVSTVTFWRVRSSSSTSVPSRNKRLAERGCTVVEKCGSSGWSSFGCCWGSVCILGFSPFGEFENTKNRLAGLLFFWVQTKPHVLLASW